MKIYKLVTLVFVLTALVCTQIVSAVSPMVISVCNTEVYAGETVTIPVTLSNNTGFVSASLYIEYDESVLTLVGINEKLLISGTAHWSNLYLQYLLLRNQAITILELVLLLMVYSIMKEAKLIAHSQQV